MTKEPVESGTLSAVRRTVVVWPGVIIMAGVVKGFVYTASISTTVKLWLAMAKKSSSLSAAFMIRNK